MRTRERNKWGKNTTEMLFYWSEFVIIQRFNSVIIIIYSSLYIYILEVPDVARTKKNNIRKHIFLSKNRDYESFGWFSVFLLGGRN